MRQNTRALSLALATVLGFSQSAALAQQSRNFYRAPSSFAGKTVILPIGTQFEGRIQSTIGSRQSHSGDSFSVEVSAPVMANGTEVLIPSGSEIIGEVAEAQSSSSQPHDKNKYAPMGILRVQLTGLKLPDGQSYPLIASFAQDGRRGNKGAPVPTRKSTVAYVGTQAGFDAVNPALQPRNPRSGSGKLQVLKKSEIMSDPVLGDSDSHSSQSGQIRALIRKGRELMILRGSSMTIRLDGPLKISLGSSNAQNSMDGADEPVPTPGGKHFAKTRPAQAEAPQGSPQEQGNMDQGNMMAQPQQQVSQPEAGNQQSQQSARQQAPVEQPGSSF